MPGSSINGTVYPADLLYALRRAAPVLIEAGEGMGKTSLARYVMQQNTSSLAVLLLLDHTVGSILEAVWRAYGKQVRALIEDDAGRLSRMKAYGANAGTPLQMVAVDLADEKYPLERWFHRRKADGADAADVDALQALMKDMPPHEPVQSDHLLLDEIRDCSRALGLGENPSTLWIEVSPHFDWARHGAMLTGLLSRPALRNTRYLSIRLLMQPGDVHQLRAHGVDVTSFERCELMWTFDDLQNMADHQTAGWFARFAQRGSNTLLLQKLYEDALTPATRILAPSPKCWTHLARLLKERGLDRVRDPRDWHFALRDCCRDTRKLRVSDAGIFVGGDRLDQNGLIKPVEVSILKAIYHLQMTQKAGPPTAAEVAQHINLFRRARKPAKDGSVMKAVHDLRRRVCFEPVFRFLRDDTSTSDDDILNDYLVYLCNADTSRRYQLQNIE